MSSGLEEIKKKMEGLVSTKSKDGKLGYYVSRNSKTYKYALSLPDKASPEMIREAVLLLFQDEFKKEIEKTLSESEGVKVSYKVAGYFAEASFTVDGCLLSCEGRGFYNDGTYRTCRDLKSLSERLKTLLEMDQQASRIAGVPTTLAVEIPEIGLTLIDPSLNRSLIVQFQTELNQMLLIPRSLASDEKSLSERLKILDQTPVVPLLKGVPPTLNTASTPPVKVEAPAIAMPQASPQGVAGDEKSLSERLNTINQASLKKVEPKAPETTAAPPVKVEAPAIATTQAPSQSLAASDEGAKPKPKRIYRF